MYESNPNIKLMENNRQKIIDCADSIIDYINEQMIIPRVHEQFNHQLTTDEVIDIAHKVYNQIKLRM